MLLHRAEHVITEEEERTNEVDKCRYPKVDAEQEDQQQHPRSSRREDGAHQELYSHHTLCKSLSEELDKTFRKFGCNVIYKEQNTLR